MRRRPDGLHPADPETPAAGAAVPALHPHSYWRASMNTIRRDALRKIGLAGSLIAVPGIAGALAGRARSRRMQPPGRRARSGAVRGHP